MTASSSPRPLLDAFADLTDPRSARGWQFSWDAILLIALCAVIGGAHDLVAVAACGRDPERWLSRGWYWPHGMPSPDTFARLFRWLDPEALAEGMRCWRVRAQERLRGVVARDGQTRRRSHDQAQGPKPLPLVSAWSHDEGLTLGQVATDVKSHEITAMPLLRAMRAREDCTVTLEALGGQRAMAPAIWDRKAHSILHRKSHQGHLRRHVEATFT